jgi:CspA family cold shock protein
MANVVYCVRCGRKFLEDIAYCRFCGAEKPDFASEAGAKKVTFDVMLQAIENGELAAISVGPEVGLAPGEVCYLAAAGGGFGFFHGIPPIGYRGDLYVTDKRILFKPNRLASQTPGASHPELEALTFPLDKILECFESKPSISIVTGRTTANGRVELFTSQLVMPSEEYGKVVLALISKLKPPPKAGQPQEGVFEAQEAKPPQKDTPHFAEPPPSVEGVGGQTADSGPEGSEGTPRVQGNVKWFNNSKGYGLIAAQNGQDVFVHYSAISGAGFKTLQEGDLVEFEIVQGTHGPMAMRVVKLGEAHTGARPQATATVVSLVANHVRSAFPKTNFEVYIDHIRVIHVGWVGIPDTTEVRSSLRALVLGGQMPTVEFDFQHTDPEASRQGESPQGAPNAVSSVASRLKSSFPKTTFEVYSQNENVVHVAWRGGPKTDEVRTFLQTLRLQHQIPNVDLNFHHADTRGEASRSSASSGKHRTKSRAQAKALSQKLPHEILGVRLGAPLAEVTSAYRRLAILYHPDKVAGLAPEYQEIAERKMKEINAAYEELKRLANQTHS